ncbi:leucine-rich repeat protein 1-like [Gigantopelta aegis]|uniref:leucine-rich repeat protein 1-like n=1 Tax=Gigantopelta aegis TaxID=1735272 RepID=UPI001B88BE19|nr:leucine-rich repeat protein 1-like [Gigantopelta aegis]XP_041353672.1 leucine-rich repeat protein 1-like [Gigantopelta aegis]XP_041353673.1 leucine-rich repeat protein 1-like [Gigantopelta aegis]
MRLTCDVELVNRLLPSFNLKKASRSCRAQVSLGKKPASSSKDGALFLMVCTAKDRNGVKFLVKGNIEQIFGKFVSDGKATIRIRDPQQDVCISKADPLQLKNILNLIHQASQGKDLDRTALSALTPASARQVEKPKTKMTILTRKDYPLTTTFPSSLESLQVSQCSMKRIDQRILQLSKLKILNLSHNSLQSLPESYGRIYSLYELYVNNNQLTKLPISLCRSSLSTSLVVLDISENQITTLPLELCELKQLVTLKADKNDLKSLPATIGKLIHLKSVSVAHNKLAILPAGLTRLQLDHLDLYCNPLELQQTESVIMSQLTFPTLVECCARSIKKYRVPYTDEDLFPQLCQYLDSARHCWCGNYCFQCCARYIATVDLRRVSATVTAWDNVGTKLVPVEAFLCSQNCLTKFQNNSVAYWK